ncbi:MAG: Thiol-disulfide oxidoreductase ResA [Bacteroidota bacterium]|jgi:thiol-disulfide isomerase/thioredoxin
MYGIKKNVFAVALVFMAMFSNAQSIKGKLPLLANQEISLEGFNGLQTYVIATTSIDANGNFKLAYANTDLGMGYLKSTDNKPLFVVLSAEDIEIIGESLSSPQTVTITKGYENQWFEQYAKEYPLREQALSAWDYLEKIYTQEVLFVGQKTPNKAIKQERKRINNEDVAFLYSLPKESYCRWFLPTRKLVSSVATIAQYRTKEIPATIAAFRALDYTDKRLYKSGLFKDAIEAHFWLLENSGKPLDSVFIEMQFSIDAMMANLKKDEQKLNEVTSYLFNLLEKHSLFKASEYLSLKVLNEVSCTINSDLARQLETYRAMKVGNTAPDIVFPSIRVNPTNNLTINKLSDLSSNYTLVVFGASWCPNCKEEIPAIAKLYSTCKAKGVEVLLVSLDEDEKAFYEFTSNFPFISITDLKKWDGSIVKDYYVFGTPSMYLLDKNRKIILRPNSVKQMEAWVDGIEY